MGNFSIKLRIMMIIINLCRDILYNFCIDFFDILEKRCLREENKFLHVSK